MHFAPVRAAPRIITRRLGIFAAVTAATFVLSFTSLAATAHASTNTTAADTAAMVSDAHVAATHSVSTAASKKAVIVVGPVGSQTAEYVQGARDIAKIFTDAGMQVVLILPPHATWSAVVSAANGADFFAYLGHGNGWPAPYGTFREDSKDGLGLNPTDGDTNSNDVAYYGANLVKASIVLAPNAIVLLNRLCYADGNGEPGSALPTQDVAFQRADNFASAFLAIGAKVVFALGWQPGSDLATALVNTHETMDNFFMWKDGEGTEAQYQPWHGWIGWKPDLYLSSVRTPGATVHLDPHPTAGYLRAVSGDLGFTTDEWWGGSDSGDKTPPAVTSLTLGSATNTSPAGGDITPVFTPNGDGISDTLTINHTLSEPSYLDISVAHAGGTLVREFTSYSVQGATTDVWDGTNASAGIVPDGAYTITITPKDRAGNVGHAVSINVKVLTAMRSPKANPKQFYAADNDTLAQWQTQKVALDKPANLTWVIKDRSGAVVRHAMTNEFHPVGLVSWAWNGRNDAGAYVPDGAYTMSITASTSAGSYSHEVRVTVAPFKVTASAWTGTAGQKIKLTIVTSEAQAGWPKIVVAQPGLATYSVRAVKSSSTKFTATLTLRAGGQPGSVTVRISGTDVKGGVDTRFFNLTIQ